MLPVVEELGSGMAVVGTQGLVPHGGDVHVVAGSRGLVFPVGNVHAVGSGLDLVPRAGNGLGHSAPHALGFVVHGDGL